MLQHNSSDKRFSRYQFTRQYFCLLVLFLFPTPPPPTPLSISLIRLSVLNSDQISPRIAPISILYQQKAATLNSE